MSLVNNSDEVVTAFASSTSHLWFSKNLRFLKSP
jgi:hypothetical protein